MTESLKSKSIEERNNSYINYVHAVSPQTSMFKSLFKSFLIGGFTCLIGEIIGDVIAMSFPQLSLELVSSYTSMILVTVAILFTGFGFYDVIARHGGAGSFLPITGFANAMASASMEFKTEGLIMGTSVKMFSVVGPVVINGIVWSAVAGIIRYLISIFFVI